MNFCSKLHLEFRAEKQRLCSAQSSAQSNTLGGEWRGSTFGESGQGALASLQPESRVQLLVILCVSFVVCHKSFRVYSNLCFSVGSVFQEGSLCVISVDQIICQAAVHSLCQHVLRLVRAFDPGS